MVEEQQDIKLIKEEPAKEAEQIRTSLESVKSYVTELETVKEDVRSKLFTKAPLYTYHSAYFQPRTAFADLMSMLSKPTAILAKILICAPAASITSLSILSVSKQRTVS